MEKGVIDQAYANGGVLEEGAGASILQSLDNELAHQLIPDDPLLLKYGLALSSGYRSLSEAAINHFMGPRTYLEHAVRQALCLTETEYYERLSLILADARRLGLIGVADGAMDLPLDHWHVPYWGEKLIGRYGYHYNGMMRRSFPGIHPLPAYDLTDECFVLITPPPSSSVDDDAADVTGLEGLSFCERLGFKVGSVRGDRGLSTVEFVEGAGLERTTYYLGVKANSILREHIRGRGWVENEETGERACVRRGPDYLGVRTNLIALSKMGRKNPGKRRVFLFITNDDSRSDPFDLPARPV